MKSLDVLRVCCLLGLHDKSMWEAGAGLYVTRQGSFGLHSKFGPLLMMPIWWRHVRQGGMFREPLITAPACRSQDGMFNCIPHHTVLINKVTAFTGRAQCVCVYVCECVSVCVSLFSCKYELCALKQRASAPPWLLHWRCKPEQRK